MATVTKRFRVSSRGAILIARRSVLAAALATPLAAQAVTVYVGPAFASGAAVPTGAGSGNARADTIPSLTYIFNSGAYTAPAAQNITITSVNLANQSAGTITPFLAAFTGGATGKGSSYRLLVTGDAFGVAAGNSSGVLVNHAFTVGGQAATLALTAGEVLVAGLYQSSTNVVFSGGPNERTLIYRGNTIGTAGSAFPATPNFLFDGLHYQYNIGFTGGVPEPATWGLMVAGFGLVGIAVRRRPAAARA